MAIFRIRNVIQRDISTCHRIWTSSKESVQVRVGPTYADIRMYGIRVSSSRTWLIDVHDQIYNLT